MLFNSFEYLAFFAAAAVIFYLIPGRFRSLWLLLASYAFYMNWNRYYAVLLLAATLISYICGAWIAGSRSAGRKAVLAGCVGLLLLLLAVFKYARFILENLSRLPFLAGERLLPSLWELALPVGISFYLFKAISYVADIYLGRIEPEKNLISYALYISFFPQLASGPIDRPANLLGQINRLPQRKRPSFSDIDGGVTLMLWGLFMKMVIADRLALFVDTVFNRYFLYGSIELALAAAGYALQIYCDFAGYSLVAIGSARVLGFSTPDNFLAPYLALSVRDFWRRWHISLSSWFRDYVYIPLGGSRCSRPRKYLNQMLTMLVSGLWHGSGWRFVIWGALHGIYQIAEDVFGRGRKQKSSGDKSSGKAPDTFSSRLGRRLVTFAAVDFAWIFFRAPSARDALLYIRQMFTSFRPLVLFDGSLFQLGLDTGEFHILAAAVLVLVMVDTACSRRKQRVDEMLRGESLWFRYAAIIALFTAVWVFGMYGPAFTGSQFIYLQF